MRVWGRKVGTLDEVIVRNSPNLANCSLPNESAASGVARKSLGRLQWSSYLTNEITVFREAIKSAGWLAWPRVLSDQRRGAGHSSLSLGS